MKVVHMMSHAEVNGVATSTKAVIDAQLRAGYEVLLVHLPDAWIARQVFPGPVEFVESQFSVRPDDLRKTGYPLRKWGRDLVHAHGSRANKLLMIYRIADGVPSVMTAHARLFQIPWLFAHEIIGLSAQTTRFYVRSLLASRHHINAVPNMFDASALTPVTPARRATARAELGLTEDALVVGFVGAASARKRQADLVWVLAKLVAGGGDIHLVLIGEQAPAHDYGAVLDAALSDPRVAGRVHLTGHRLNAIALVPAFDVFVMASGREEAPIAPLEAMAQAIPVVSTDVGNMSDLLPSDRLAPIGDIDRLARATARLLADPALRSKEGQSDRATTIAKLSAAVIVPQIEMIYRSAMARARDRGRHKPVPSGWD